MDELHKARELNEGLQEVVLGLIESPNDCDKALSVVYAVVEMIGDSLRRAEDEQKA